MKTKYTISGFFLAVLVFAGFAACENPIMKEWWDNDSAPTIIGDKPAQPGAYYTVHFDPNDGSTTPGELPEHHPEDQLIADGSKITAPPGGNSRIKSTEYFSGWYMQPECINLWNFDSALTGEYTTNGVMTLYAGWSPTPRTVRFDSSGGSARPREQVVADGSTALIEPAAGTKPGYGFAGWYSTPTFTEEPWDFNAAVTKDMMLYAKWELPHCTVTFVANGGSPIPEDQDLANGQKIRVPAAMARAGYGFAGWYENQNYTGAPWDFATSVTATAITLYAKWVGNLYTVTFAANGGSPAPAAQTVAHGNHVQRPAIMTKTGEGFGGWYNQDGDKEWDFLMDTVTKNITLYAKWGTLYHTVQFINDDETMISEQIVVDGGKATRPPDPDKSAYAFKGWYTASDTNNRTLFNFDDPITSPTTIHARWVKHNPVIVYVPGGSFSMGVSSGTGSAGERKAHTVTVSGFYIYPVETTQKQIDLITWWKKWEGLVDDMSTYNFWSSEPNGHGFNPSAAKGESRPIESITWYDAVYLCNLATEYENKITRKGLEPFELAYTITDIVHADGNLGKKPSDDENWIAGYAILDNRDTNNKVTRTNTSIVSATVTLNPNVIDKPEVVGYRLPTEAEWEYAARGGNGSPGDYPWAGSDNAGDVAWYLENTTQTQTPGGKAPNGLGLYDMSGNVCEWLWDKYSATYYGESINATDPLGPSGENGAPPVPPGTLAEERTRRGGSIRHGAEKCKTQVRDSWPANKLDNWNIGFRIVRSGEE